MHPGEALTMVGGVASARQLRGQVSERALRRAIRSGEVVHVARGAYALPGARKAAVAAARVHGTLACLSAAEAAGWELARPPDRPWVAVPRNRGRVDGRGLHLLFSDERETDPVRIVMQCARRLQLREALAVADSALRSGQVDADELVMAAAAMRGPGAAACRRVAELASPLKANPFESALHALAAEVPGLDVVPQLAIDLPGVTIHPDLVDERLRLVIEAEGWLFHAATPESFERDVWRYTTLVATGWLVVRFTHGHVMRQPEFVLDSLSALVQACSSGRRGR